MSDSKKARSPSEGIYYVVPNKDGHVSVFSEREDEANEGTVTHLFFWERVLRHVEHEYKLTPSEVHELKTHYMAVPRGRVQKEIDTQTFKPTGKYVILHGGDVPVSTIEYAVLQDFGLGGLKGQGKVIWKIEAHEKIDPSDREIFQEIINEKENKNVKKKVV